MNHGDPECFRSLNFVYSRVSVLGFSPLLRVPTTLTNICKPPPEIRLGAQRPGLLLGVHRLAQRDCLVLGLHVARDLKLTVILSLRLRDPSFALKQDSERSVKRWKSSVQAAATLEEPHAPERSPKLILVSARTSRMALRFDSSSGDLEARLRRGSASTY